MEKLFCEKGSVIFFAYTIACGSGVVPLMVLAGQNWVVKYSEPGERSGNVFFILRQVAKEKRYKPLFAAYKYFTFLEMAIAPDLNWWATHRQ